MRIPAFLIFATLAVGGSTCDFDFGPGSRTLSGPSIKSAYGNYIFRLRAGEDQGTGFVVDQDSAYVLTAYHVVMNARPGAVIEGDLESRPGIFFRFHIVKSLCTAFDGWECKSPSGEYNAGVDASLLVMDEADRATYQSFLNPALPPFDIVLGPKVGGSVYKAGFPQQGDRTRAPILVAPDPFNTTKDWGVGQYTNNHKQWRLLTTASPGESGSPVFDSNGNVFAILTNAAQNDASKGVALALTEVLDLLKIVFKTLKPTSTGQRLRSGLLHDSYHSVDEIATDLFPNALSNKELAAVILDVASPAPPKFRFKHCPVDIALNDRNLGAVYAAWEPDDANVDPQVHTAFLLDDATGLVASGQPAQAAVRYSQAYQLSKNTNQDVVIQMRAALGAAGAYKQTDQRKLARTYGTTALQLANGIGVKAKEYVALASTYLYDLALKDGDRKSAKVFAKSAFAQAPNPVYKTMPANQREPFRTKDSFAISADEWAGKTAAIQSTLEPKLLRVPLGHA